MPETEKLAGKVREKKMGELFENMDKMDIQAERRNTALERRRADEAEERAEKAEQRADEAQKRAEETEKKAALAEEDGIKQLVGFSQELGASMDMAVQSLMGEKPLSQEEALEKVRLYWNGLDAKKDSKQ